MVDNKLVNIIPCKQSSQQGWPLPILNLPIWLNKVLTRVSNGLGKILHQDLLSAKDFMDFLVIDVGAAYNERYEARGCIKFPSTYHRCVKY